MRFILILSTLLITSTFAQKVSYEGYKLYDLFPKTQEQIDLLAQLEHEPDFDMWSRIRPEGVKVSLGPKVVEKYQRLFKKFKINYEIVHHNLQEQIDEEENQMKRRDLVEGRIVGTYARPASINSFILDQVSLNPSIASSYIAGKSSEGRDLRVIVLKTSTSKRKIWLDCGIHAREWVSPSTCVWVIDKLIKEYKANNATTVSILSYFEIHILPVVNPDGYEYSHTTDRMWRKNRRTNSGSTCKGVDLNRNYGFQWMTGGSSNNPCVDTYAGPSANSELETQAVINAINAARGQWDAFLTIHAYGKWWFTPYGWTKTLPTDFTEQNAKAKIGSDAIMASGENGWTYGSSANMLYIASGGSEDWAYGNAGIKYSYCLELRPGQTGPDSSLGFRLPESKAPLAGEETYQGIKAFLRSIRP